MQKAMAGELESHFCQREKIQSCYVRRMGIAVNSFTPSKRNLCRKAISAEALHMLVNFSTQDYLFSHFRNFQRLIKHT